MTTLNLQIGALTDDAQDNQTSCLANIPSMTIGELGGSVDGAFRFTPVGIPQGAIINEATFSVYANTGSGGGPVNTQIHAVDLDSHITYAYCGGAPPSRLQDAPDFPLLNLTAASVPWVLRYSDTGSDPGPYNWPPQGGAPGFRSPPSVRAAVQEVIDRPGWVSGNPLAIAFMDDATAALNIVTLSGFELDAAQAAKLDIDFTTGPVAPQINDATVAAAADSDTISAAPTHDKGVAAQVNESGDISVRPAT